MQNWRFLLKLILLCHLGSFEAQARSYKLVTLDFPPLEMLDEKGKVTGVAVEIVTEIFGKLGHTVEISLLPWARALALTMEGKADAIFTIYRLPERESFLDYSVEEIIPQPVSLYVRTNTQTKYQGDIKAIVGSKVGTLNSISYGKIFDGIKSQLKIERVDTMELNFKMLMAGRIDYVVSNSYSAASTLAKLGLEKDIIELEPPVEITPSYIAFSKKKALTALRDRFDTELRLFKKGPRYAKILSKYRVKLPKTAL